MSFFGEPAHVQTILSVDRSGGSVARTADYNCACVGRVQVVDGKQALVLVDAKMERLRDSELIEEILVPLVAKHHLQTIVFEEDRHWADFEMNLRRELARRGIPVRRGIRHTPIDTDSKFQNQGREEARRPVEFWTFVLQRRDPRFGKYAFATGAIRRTP